MIRSADDTPHLACSLDARHLQERVAWIAELNNRYLRRTRRAARRLELFYDLSAASDVALMVDRERTCCAFLRFDVRQRGNELVVTIDAPEGSDEVTDARFAPFLVTAAFASTTGCCGECEKAPVELADTPVDMDAPAMSSVVQRPMRMTAATVATLAVACAACCTLPLAATAMALTSAGGILAWFSASLPWAKGIAVVMVGLGWLWVFRSAARAEARTASATLWTMGGATLLLGTAFAWPLLERILC